MCRRYSLAHSTNLQIKMNRSGHIEVVNVNGIDFIDCGTTLRIEIVDSIPPYNTSYVLFKGVIVSKLFKETDDEFPLNVVDLTWHVVHQHNFGSVLADHGFPFSGKTKEYEKLVIAHFEGDIVGDVISESIFIEKITD